MLEPPEFVSVAAQVSLPTITRDWPAPGVVSLQGHLDLKSGKVGFPLDCGEAGCLSH